MFDIRESVRGIYDIRPLIHHRCIPKEGRRLGSVCGEQIQLVFRNPHIGFLLRAVGPVAAFAI